MKISAILGILLGLYMIWSGIDSDILFFAIMGALMTLFCGAFYAILTTKREIEISNDLLNELMGEKE